MKESTFINLIKVARYVLETIDDYANEYERFCGDFDLDDFILDEMGFPIDNTGDYENLEEASKKLGDKLFCRDYLTFMIYDDKIKPKNLYKRLIEELNELDNSL